ncbi:MAG: GNAT family acetyltransferase [Sphingopyxis sp.]|nr:MAG: GNAT family acetyltransferase [Sphingopyxis sp.]
MMRRAGDEDLAAVVALWEACGLTRPWNDATADFVRAVQGPGSDILLLELDGRLAATVMVGDDGHRGWVYYLGVAPDQRGSGLGRILMDAAEAWLRDRDAPKIQLMVREDNEAAIGFYTALGYEVQPVVTIGRRLN